MRLITDEEMAKLQEDKARLDYLEEQRLKRQTRGNIFGWDAFHYRVTADAPSVREQLDSERGIDHHAAARANAGF